MLYDISQTVSYRYDGASAGGRHLLRLMPADLTGEQRLIAGHLDIEPEPVERIAQVDFFGNAAAEISLPFAHSALEFRVRARVERRATAPAADTSPLLDALAAEIADCRSLEPSATHHFAGPSPRVAPHREMTEYARSAVGGTATALEAVLAIGAALHRDMRFDAKATHADTDPAEAFAQRHGVCQDFSHVMIACLRGIGVPAGYVSGYLRTLPPAGQPRLQGADAMHAWVRAWCGRTMGWVEYDPTNTMLAGTDHVVVARGRDYSDVSPVKGVLRTPGGQTSRHAVDIVPVGAG
jgi:transglutaminase-like putative cysteine protease